MLENITRFVANTISGLPLLGMPVAFLGGILTSFNPCVLSMLPVLVGYIGGYSGVSKKRGFLMALVFSLGLATTFAILGIIATSLGLIFGQISSTWYIVMAIVAILMGLNLLEVFKINMPGIKRLPIQGNSLPIAYLMGLSFGLVASPCATPVLATILAFVSTQGNVLYGSALLFAYGLGLGVPLIVAGTFTASLKTLPKIQAISKYITYASGAILIILGLYLLYRFI